VNGLGSRSSDVFEDLEDVEEAGREEGGDTEAGDNGYQHEVSRKAVTLATVGTGRKRPAVRGVSTGKG